VAVVSGTVWYFAEGFTGDGWETYLYLLNATSVVANVTITYFQQPARRSSRPSMSPPRAAAHYWRITSGSQGRGCLRITITSDQPITANNR